MTLTGDGAGTVASTPAGIDCGGGGPCAATFASGAAVTLQATSAIGSEHDGFTGASVGATCTLAPAGAAAVTAISGVVAPSAPGNVLALGGGAAAARSRPARAPAPGDFLLGFGGGGAWTADPSAHDESPRDAVVAGGALYVTGDAQAGAVEIRVEKLDLATAARFPAFGAGGVVRSDPSAGYDGAWAAATDGEALWLAGDDMRTGRFDDTWRVEKRDLVGGALVAAFGGGGVGLGTDQAVDVLVAGGSLYVIGFEQDAGGPRGRIEKRSAVTGELASGFGTGGASLFLVGSDRVPGNRRWRVDRRAR